LPHGAFGGQEYEQGTPVIIGAPAGSVIGTPLSSTMFSATTGFVGAVWQPAKMVNTPKIAVFFILKLLIDLYTKHIYTPELKNRLIFEKKS
jgi:hypothetical protein